MEQSERNKIAEKVFNLLKKQKADIIDSLDILNNLSSIYLKELMYNLNNA